MQDSRAVGAAFKSYADGETRRETNRVQAPYRTVNQFDQCLPMQDPHAVGVAFKSGAGGKAGREIDLADDYEEPKWLRKGSKQRKSNSRKPKGFAK